MNILLHIFGFRKNGGEGKERRGECPFPRVCSTYEVHMELQVELGFLPGGSEGTSRQLLDESTRVVEHRQGRTQVVRVHQQPPCARMQRDVALGEEERTLGIILRFLIRLFSISFALNSSIVFISSI